MDRIEAAAGAAEENPGVDPVRLGGAGRSAYFRALLDLSIIPDLAAVELCLAAGTNYECDGVPPHAVSLPLNP
jgi:hypothetical protein